MKYIGQNSHSVLRRSVIGLERVGAFIKEIWEAGPKLESFTWAVSEKGQG